MSGKGKGDGGKGKGDGKGKGGKGKGDGKGKGKGGKGKGAKGKGGKGKGAKGGAKTVVEPHRHEGVFIARGKEDVLVTRSSVPGDAVCGEKRISVEEGEGDEKTKIEYRVWFGRSRRVGRSVAYRTVASLYYKFRFTFKY